MADAGAANSRFYDPLWSAARLTRPEQFNTWPLLSGLRDRYPRSLEIGPGLRPRLPLTTTRFLDASPAAVERLNSGGGDALCGDICRLPYQDASFDLVCAFDVIEHVEESGRALGEAARVLDDNGMLVFSVPLHRNRWSEFDRRVGHMCRFDPEELLSLLTACGLQVLEHAPFGMRPANPRLVAAGLWFLHCQSRMTFFWYNRILMPLALRFQKPLVFRKGLAGVADLDEVLCVCLKGGEGPRRQ